MHEPSIGPQLPQAPKPMTVLQILPNLETGGAERTAIDIAKALIQHGHRAIIASEGGRLEKELIEAGGEVIRLPAASKNPVIMISNALYLISLIRKLNIDVLHARSRAPAWSALLASRWTGCPFVTTYHGAYKQNHILKSLYNSVMARADVIIANSRWTADLIVQRHPNRRHHIVIIYRGTDLSRFKIDHIDQTRMNQLRQAWNIADNHIPLLHIARLSRWKGQHVVIDAMARLANRYPNLIAILAGDEQGRLSYRSELEDHIARLGLRERVRLVGHCNDVPAALSIARLLVVASTEPEAFGRAAVEAQAMGLPTIVTDLGAVKETVLAPPEVEEQYRTGWRIPHSNAQALEAAVHNVLAFTASERAHIGARAMTHAHMFSLTMMTEKTLAIYTQLTSQKFTDTKRDS